VATDGGPWFVVEDGKAGRQYDTVYHERLRYSPDGRLVYVVYHKGREFAVVAGKEWRKYDKVGGLSFSPDGKHVAYPAKDKAGWKMATSKAKTGYCEEVGSLAVFSPDGKRFAYAARKGGSWFIVSDGSDEGPYMGVSEGSMAYGPGGRFAYKARVSKLRWAVVVDGVKIGMADSMEGDIVFSPSGAHIAYAAVQGMKQYVAMDGRPGELADGVVTWGGGRVAFDDEAGFHYLVMDARRLYLVEESFE
jgi:hypothetical protein